MPSDNCTMLRFTDCQFKNDSVFPYVWMKDYGALGIWFERIHAEIASTTPLTMGWGRSPIAATMAATAAAEHAGSIAWAARWRRTRLPREPPLSG